MKPRDKKQKVNQSDDKAPALPPLANQQIKCVRPMTFSQKFYQSHELEIAQEFEQALEDNSLEKIKLLLDKLLEISD